MKTILLFLLSLLCFSHGLASATDHYVSKTGDDGNPGTEAAPWRTIQKAADVLVAGDRVLIRGGTYFESVQPIHSGQPGSFITYRSYPGEQAIEVARATIWWFTIRYTGMVSTASARR